MASVSNVVTLLFQPVLWEWAFSRLPPGIKFIMALCCLQSFFSFPSWGADEFPLSFQLKPREFTFNNILKSSFYDGFYCHICCTDEFITHTGFLKESTRQGSYTKSKYSLRPRPVKCIKGNEEYLKGSYFCLYNNQRSRVFKVISFLSFGGLPLICHL